MAALKAAKKTMISSRSTEGSRRDHQIPQDPWKVD